MIERKSTRKQPRIDRIDFLDFNDRTEQNRTEDVYVRRHHSYTYPCYHTPSTFILKNFDTKKCHIVHIAYFIEETDGNDDVRNQGKTLKPTKARSLRNPTKTKGNVDTLVGFVLKSNHTRQHDWQTQCRDGEVSWWWWWKLSHKRQSSNIQISNMRRSSSSYCTWMNRRCLRKKIMRGTRQNAHHPIIIREQGTTMKKWL